MGDEHRILFVCTGNTCRSPMAAALFNKLNTKPGWRADSGGLSAFYGNPPSELAVTALRLDYDLDLSGHLSHPVTAEDLSQADWILTQTRTQRDILQLSCPELAGRVLTIGEMAGEPELSIADPFGRDLETYRQTAATLARLIEKIITQIC
jgi:protein-tyrosine-phosphatase